MKLANIKPLQEMGGELPVGNRDDDDLDEMRKMKTKGDDEDPPGMKDMREADHDDDRDKPGMKDMREEEEDDDPPGMKDMREEEMDMDMGGDGMEMDMKMDAPAPDMDMGGKEEQFADIVDKLADLLGLDADVEVGGDEDMGGEAMGDEGGDLEGAMDAPVGDEDPMMEADEDEMNEEEIVQEVARRVAARLLREKKQDDMANRLAESIFNKLTSK
jgi:hypothetical protein